MVPPCVFCPCAVNYLHHTIRAWGTNRSLLVHWEEAKAHCPVSKHWIAATLSEATHHIYCLVGWPHKVICANPHSIWGVAASWAKIASMSASEICHAATWSSSYTFAKHYRLDLLRGLFGPHVFDVVM